MKKYFKIFQMSLESELTYKVNFVISRLRNVISILVAYFLWDTVFSDSGRIIFGYKREQVITYIFLILIVRAIVLSSKSTEVAGEIGRGELSNYLVKPLSYFKYWFTKDLASKLLNIFLASFEFLLLFYLLKPDIFFQTNVFYLLGFVVSIALAIIIYFILVFIVSTIPFWASELGWGSHFLITVILVEFLSGALFPLDIFPVSVQKVIFLTPFPYLLYVPTQIYLGKVPLESLAGGIGISIFWVFSLYFVFKAIWNKGLKAYQAYGR